MDSIVDDPRHPAPLNLMVLVSKKNTVEKLLYITQRYRGCFWNVYILHKKRKFKPVQGSFHKGRRRWSFLFRLHQSNLVPTTITDFYETQRDIVFAKKSSKNTAAATAPHSALIMDDPNES